MLVPRNLSAPAELLLPLSPPAKAAAAVLRAGLATKQGRRVEEAGDLDGGPDSADAWRHKQLIAPPEVRAQSAYDALMAKQDLPPEVSGLPLAYGQLISTLDAVEGESVIVKLSSREDDDHSTAGIASIVGELKHKMPARYEGHEFSIGSPYSEMFPDYLAGGILFIREDTFESATLSTFDGNDYFIIGITTRALNIIVQDGDSTAP